MSESCDGSTEMKKIWRGNFCSSTASRILCWVGTRAYKNLGTLLSLLMNFSSSKASSGVWLFTLTTFRLLCESGLWQSSRNSCFLTFQIWLCSYSLYYVASFNISRSTNSLEKCTCDSSSNDSCSLCSSYSCLFVRLSTNAARYVWILSVTRVLRVWT